MKQKWFTWVAIAALLLTSWVSQAGISMAEEQSATIEAKQVDDKLQISGKTGSSDPEWVPLLIKDAQGHLLYFQDVNGNGKAFQIEINVPEWTVYGTAEVILYANTPVTDRFEIKKEQDSGKKKIRVSLEIIGFNDDEIVKQTSFSLSKGSSVFQLLRLASEENNFDFEVKDPEQDGHDVYLVGIQGLSEFDKGPASGWIYKVNDKGPPMSIDRYILKDGDDVEILYTTDLGKSQNVPSGESITSLYRAPTSANVNAAINKLINAESVEEIVSIVHTLLLDLSEYELEKQATFVPDVGLFLQAAYEHAARVDVKESRVVNPLEPDIQELSLLTIRELLNNQQELREKLEELLANSTLYKPLLSSLKPVILVPYPANSESRVGKIFITSDAWEKLKESGVVIVLEKSDWRAEIVPTVQTQSKDPISFTVRKYSDAEQTEQFNQWQSTIDSPAVPVTASFRIDATQPSIASLSLSTIVTGSTDELVRPALFSRKSADQVWKPSVVLIQEDKMKLSVPVQAGNDVVVVMAVHSFEDVMMLHESRKEWQQPIAALYQWGITQGLTPTNFGVDQPLTRAQFFAMVARLEQPDMTGKLVTTTGNSTETTFDDVPESSWFAPTVKQAVLLGWTEGRSQSRFAPNDVMTRAEVASLLVRLFEKEQTVVIEDKAAEHINLTGVPAWAKHSVLVAAMKKWLTPRANGLIDSQAAITRGEAAYAIYQYYLSKNSTE